MPWSSPSSSDQHVEPCRSSSMPPATVAEPEASRLSLFDVLLRQDGLPSPGPARFCRCRCFPSPSAAVPMLSRRASTLEQAHELQLRSPSSLPSGSRRPAPPRPLHRRERVPAPLCLAARSWPSSLRLQPAKGQHLRGRRRPCFPAVSNSPVTELCLFLDPFWSTAIFF